MKSKEAAILFFLSIILSSCGPAEKEITGEIFIVAQSGQSIKLGLVEVSIIPKAEMESHLSKKIQAALPEIERLKPSYNKLKLEYAASNKELSKNVELLEGLRNEDERDRFNIALNEGDRFNKTFRRIAIPFQAERVEESRNKFIEKEKEFLPISAEYEKYNNSSYFLGSCPKSVQTTKSNADGIFMLRLKPGSYALKASTSIKIDKETKDYCWLLSISVDKKKKNQLMLSNDNLFDTNCSDCLVPIKQLR